MRYNFERVSSLEEISIRTKLNATSLLKDIQGVSDIQIYRLSGYS